MDRNVSDESRRDFLRKTGGAAAATLAGPMLVPRRAFGAGDRIRAAVLGVNGRGKSHIEDLMGLPDVEVVTLCDPDSQVAAQRAQEFEAKYGKAVKTEKDLRRVYDDKEVDVVSIATPNHWHTLATIWACQAGKDVYVEKPGSHNIWEGRKMVEAAKKHGRIVQHGVQLRSSAAIQEAVQQPAQRHDRQGLHGPRPGLPLAPRHRAVKERSPSPRTSTTISGSGPRGSGRSAGTSSTTTGTGTGSSATATSATRASTRRTCACGDSASVCRRRSRRWAGSSCSTTRRRRRRSSRPPTTTRRRRS